LRVSVSKEWLPRYGREENWHGAEVIKEGKEMELGE